MPHPVYDTDKHFTIDLTTSALTSQMSKISLVKGSHNAERFTFDFPRTVEGHDLTLCNTVEVHFLNIDAVTKETSIGTYKVEDIEAIDDEQIVFSWLIDGRATKYGGSLRFSIHFKCMEEGKLTYRYPTAVYSGILISDGIDHGDEIVEEYNDIVTAWMNDIEQSVKETIRDVVDESIGDTVTEAVDKVVGETVGEAVDKAVGEALGNSALNSSVIANAITGYASGSELLLNDISPIASKVKVNVVGKQPPEVPMMMSMMRSASPASEGLVNLVPYPYADGTSKTVNGITFLVNADGSITASGVASANAIFEIYNNTESIAPFEKNVSYRRYGSDTEKIGIKYRQYYNDSDYTFLGIVSDHSAKLQSNATGTHIYVLVTKGTDITDGVTAYPMIAATTANITEYVPPQGATADGGDHTCIDANKDHKCDICGKQLSACYDNDNDHFCDYGCGYVFGGHMDTDKDHVCDYGCTSPMGEHADNYGDGYCDYCGGLMHEHKDENQDHLCDVCGTIMSEHTDANLDHLCDKCGEYLGEHRDADGDGLCDYCHQPIDEVVTPLSVKVQTASADDPETIVETVVTVAGAIVELTPIFPAMIIKTDSEEVLLSAEYNKDTNAVIAELRDAIQEGGNVGDIDTALDAIIAIQESLIGGGTE